MRAISFGLIFALLPSSAVAEEKIVGNMMPFVSEMLPEPIRLKDSCKEVKVVEWKPTPGYERFTSPSKKSIRILNQVCNLAVSKFRSFVTKRGYHLSNKALTLKQSVSILPADLDRSGSEYRNLNDIEFRFFNRSKEFDENGKAYAIWGYFQRHESFIYVRNDVLDDNGDRNKEFEKVFAHELFHAMSYTNGVYQQHKGNQDSQEEYLAMRFSNSLED